MLNRPPPRLASNDIEQPENGSIRGTITDESGKPVAGALVTFRHFFTVQGRHQQVTSKNDGSFNIDQLPSGDYAQCVQVTKGDYVDDCQWNLTFQPRIVSTPSPTKVGVATTPGKPVLVADMPHGSDRIVVPPAGMTAPLQLQVRTGARVTFRFADSANLIDEQTHLIIGALTANGMFVPAQKSVSGAVTTFQLVIPFDTNVRLSVQSLTLRATGPNGIVNFAKGTPIEVRVGKKDPPLVFNYTITGKSR